MIVGALNPGADTLRVRWRNFVQQFVDFLENRDYEMWETLREHFCLYVNEGFHMHAIGANEEDVSTPHDMLKAFNSLGCFIEWTQLEPYSVMADGNDLLEFRLIISDDQCSFLKKIGLNGIAERRDVRVVFRNLGDRGAECLYYSQLHRDKSSVFCVPHRQGWRVEVYVEHGEPLILPSL